VIAGNKPVRFLTPDLAEKILAMHVVKKYYLTTLGRSSTEKSMTYLPLLLDDRSVVKKSTQFIAAITSLTPAHNARTHDELINA